MEAAGNVHGRVLGHATVLKWVASADRAVSPRVSVVIYCGDERGDFYFTGGRSLSPPGDTRWSFMKGGQVGCPGRMEIRTDR